MTNVKSQVIGPKTVAEWDQVWVEVPGGLIDYQPQLRRQPGLYRVWWNGRIVFIGQGTETKGGLAKRLSSLHGPSPSGRNYRAGKLIYENRARLKVEILVIDSDRYTRAIARGLKSAMIQLHRPEWNVRRPPFTVTPNDLDALTGSLHLPFRPLGGGAPPTSVIGN